MAYAIPLASVVIFWFIFASAIYSDFFVERLPDSYGNYYDSSVKLSTYLFLLGIAVLAVATLIGRQRAYQVAANPDNLATARIAKAAKAFSTIAVIVVLIIGAVFAFGTFISNVNFWNPQRDPDPLLRLLGVYLPIILAAALEVVVIIRAFVTKKPGDKDE